MRRRHLVEELGWPRWLARAQLVAPTAVGLAALAQRGTALDVRLVLAVAVIAVFVSVDVPPILARAVIAIPVVAVVMKEWPAAGDLVPFLVVLLCLDAGLGSTVAVGLTVVAASAATLIALDVTGSYQGASSYGVGAALAWLAGWGLCQLSGLLIELTAAQAGLEERAAIDERRRLAAELHDVVAHSLAVTILHLTGARLALEADDREEALDAMREAERTGRSSLDDIRRSVGLLGASQTARPEPTAAEIPALVDQMRRAGLDVDLTTVLDLPGVTPSIGLCCYRIVQESLANAVRHAPGAPVHVSLHGSAAGVRIIVHSGPSPGGAARADADDPLVTSGGRQGVNGMRRRAEAFGGRLTAGFDAGSSWIVDAEIPL